ncbi:tetratricopeptide repeat protein [Spartinivicinus poritis]|uniref:Tetratricopeptide repeat protein n=1 Tax=Spartinivicinus poritis TaxID=2994640 RepID=A0ABT5UHN2_9GAMM|nr:hypothetical protein [Spartinivicinus sp. A2-2]MDE1465909.1 hypothetical protein [Spartinivicinus sp. A2-2]
MKLKLIVFFITLITFLCPATSFAHQDSNIKTDRKNIGKIEFPISCSDDARQKFERALVLLHHMMYAQAKEHFTDLTQQEPNCAMAYWGVAMTLFQPLWPGRPSEEKLDEGWQAINKAKTIQTISPREKSYITATEAFFNNWQSLTHPQRIAAWEAAQHKTFQQLSDDINAAAFYALSHLATAPKEDKSYSHQKEAGKLLEKLYQRAPQHPGVIHYTIHAYDNPLLANRAITAARAYDKIAPDVPHALHMPTHIFVRIGLWPDVVQWNVRSAKAALNYPAGDFISHHYLHALDYLLYAHLQRGDDQAAKKTLKDMNTANKHQETFVSAYALASMPARFALERHRWREAAELESRVPASFPWEKFPQVEAISYFAKGLGATRSGDFASAQQSIQVMDELYAKTKQAGSNYWAVLVDAQRKTIAAWIRFMNGDTKAALAMMRQAADLEDSVDKHPVTPGVVLPARELLGDMLILTANYQDAINAYEASLAISPNRLNSIYGIGHANELAGNSTKAKLYYKKLFDIAAPSVQKLAQQTKGKEIRESLKQSRKFLEKHQAL